MAKAFVQGQNSGAAPSGSPLTTVLGFAAPIAAGNAVMVYIHQPSGSPRTYTVVGSVAASGWVRHIRHSAGVGGPEIWCHPNHPGGTESISVTHGSASADFRAMAAEFSGMGGTVTLAESSVYTDVAVAATHYCASAPGVTTSSDVLGILCGGASGSAWTDCFATGIWTENAGSLWMLSAYTVQPSGVTNERGQYTSSGTQRVGLGVMAFFTGASAAAPTVTDVTPDTDVPAGGESVTITGTGFVSGAAVTFGGTAATGVTVVNATTITATVPAHAEGSVAVRVTNPDAQYGELAAAFLYDEVVPMPVVLQGPIGVAMVAGLGQITLPDTVAGSRIIGIVIETDAAIRSFGVSDDVNGAYDPVIAYHPGRGVHVFEIRNNIGGDLTVVFQKTEGGSSVPVAYAMEVAHLRTDLSPLLSTFINSVSSTSHPSSASPGMNTEGYPAFVVTASAVNGTLGSASPAAGYISAGSLIGNSFVQYRVATTGVLNDQAAWTSGISRVATSVQVAFYALAGAEPPASTDGVHVAMIW